MTGGGLQLQYKKGRVEPFDAYKKEPLLQNSGLAKAFTLNNNIRLEAFVKKEDVEEMEWLVVF